MRFTIEHKYIALIFAVFGFVYLLVVTGNYNLGVSPDSVLYIEVARNIVDGNGITREIANGEYIFVTHWPPLYPVSLAFMSSITGMSILEVGRYHAAILFFLNIIVANLLFHKFTSAKSDIVILNLLLITSLAFGVHLQFWSEPLFILFLLSACYFIFLWLDTPRISYLLVGSIFSGLLLLTRYAGIGLTGGIILYLLYRKSEHKEKIKNVALYTLITIAIFSSWIFISFYRSTHPTNRDLVFHLFSVHHGVQLIGNMARWISPSFTIVGAALIFILLLILIIKEYKKNKHFFSIKDEKSQLLIFISITYLCFLVLSVSFIDFHTPLSNRVLSPLFPLLILLAVSFLGKISLKNNPLSLAILSLIILSYAYGFYDRSREFYYKGDGYTGKTWIHSETMIFLKKDSISNNIAIYTNGADAIKSLIKGSSNVHDLPNRLRAGTQVQNPGFKQEIEKLKEALRADNGMIVYFDSITWRYYLPEKEFIKNEFREFAIVELKDGLVILNRRP